MKINFFWIKENREEKKTSQKFSSTGAPLHFLNPIAEAYGATLSDDSDGGYLRPCSGDNVPNLEFTFGEAKIVMKPADLFVNLGVCRVITSD